MWHRKYGGANGVDGENRWIESNLKVKGGVSICATFDPLSPRQPNGLLGGTFVPRIGVLSPAVWGFSYATLAIYITPTEL